MNQLNALKKFSTIVADSGNIDAIQTYKPHNATTNPSLILQAAQIPNYHALLEDSLIYAKKHGGNQNSQVTNASDKLTINIGTKILEKIPGNISTEVDARLSFNLEMIIKKAHKLIQMYEEQGINKSRVLIKIAATWEGIKAAEELEKCGIKCNLTLLFSFAQARACAESNVYLISPFVGRIYDWHHQRNLIKEYNALLTDPGVEAVKKIYYYYKKHHYNTIIMAASFRTTEQILALSGCDCLTIAPKLLQQLSSNNQPVKKYLLPPKNQIFNKPIPLSKSKFFLEHNQNEMAVDLLSEGIRRFSIDQEHLDNLLITQL